MPEINGCDVDDDDDDYATMPGDGRTKNEMVTATARDCTTTRTTVDGRGGGSASLPPDGHSHKGTADIERIGPPPPLLHHHHHRHHRCDRPTIGRPAGNAPPLRVTVPVPRSWYRSVTI